MLLADRALQRQDLIGFCGERRGVGAIGVGVARIDLRELVCDLRGDGLGGGRVVEDVFVGGLLRVGPQRVGIDGRHIRIVGQHVGDPVVVVAPVEDHQRRIGDRGGVGGRRLI